MVDTDEIAHELTAAGGAAMRGDPRAVRRRNIVAADGSLDRARDARARVRRSGGAKQLEAILHPLIRAKSRARVGRRAARPTSLLVVPLLLETGAYRDLVQRMLVVDCGEDEQIARAMRRSGICRRRGARDHGGASRRAPNGSRSADDVIDNDGDLAALRAQVAQLHRQYLALARQPAAGPACTERQNTALSLYFFRVLVNTWPH